MTLCQPLASCPFFPSYFLSLFSPARKSHPCLTLLLSIPSFICRHARQSGEPRLHHHDGNSGESLPVVLQQRDLIAQAKTGSGKTAAFGLGILAKLNPTYFAVQGLVICPTRELADQVANELRRLARAIENVKILTLCGGTAMRPQIASLEHGAHIVVGTPGR
jgi:ATP-dependent helicase YprA (DUF1998 family)